MKPIDIVRAIQAGTYPWAPTPEGFFYVLDSKGETKLKDATDIYKAWTEPQEKSDEDLLEIMIDRICEFGI